MPMLEVWKWVPSYEGKYAVSNHGRVRSTDLRTGKVRVIGGSIQKAGYALFNLYSPGRPVYQVTAHRLVASLFLDPSDKPIVRHLDGNAAHNQVWNLAYGTHSDNMQDAIRHGTFTQGTPKRGVTHCPQGHPYDQVNTYHYLGYINKLPARGCRACKADWARRERESLRRTREWSAVL